ncbi:MAG: hypothetical protein K0U37_05390 [Gammaproteobacteria bacterium]|nr:hypothetical protein [Gammaproteobacteria bacterium]
MPLDLTKLTEFIETPSQKIKDKFSLSDSIQHLSEWLTDDPNVVIDIITNHPYIPASFLLEDLTEKIKQNSESSTLNNLNIIYENQTWRNQLLSTDASGYIFTFEDLKRCVTVMPAYKEDILAHVSSNDALMQRLLTSAIPEAPAETLQALIAEYPDHTEAFTDFYDRYFGASLRP